MTAYWGFRGDAPDIRLLGVRGLRPCLVDDQPPRADDGALLVADAVGGPGVRPDDGASPEAGVVADVLADHHRDEQRALVRFAASGQAHEAGGARGAGCVDIDVDGEAGEISP